MAKLIDKAKSSKLQERLNQEKTDKAIKKEKVVRVIKPKEYPRSYRIDPEVMNVLKSTLDRINEVSNRKVSETRLIRALIMLSTEIEDEKIIKALKQVW